MLAQLQRRFAIWWLYRRTLRQLELMDARMLRDMGLEGSNLRDIKAFARRSIEAGEARAERPSVRGCGTAAAPPALVE